MTEELRAKADRLIATIDSNLKRWRSWFPNERSGVDVPREDLLALKHYAEIGLATVRDDDGEPVTEEWLRSLPISWSAENSRTFKDLFFPTDIGDDFEIRIYADNSLTPDVWINNRGLAVGAATRGEVRRLLQCLKVDVKETDRG